VRFVDAWERKEKRLRFKWGVYGVKETSTISPLHKPDEHPLQTTIKMALALSILFALMLIMVLLNWLLLEIEVIYMPPSVGSEMAGIAILQGVQVYVMATPICASWFYEQVWKAKIAYSTVEEHKHMMGWLVSSITPACYNDIADMEWHWNGVGSQEVGAAGLSRGAVALALAIFEGLLIGAVYSEVFQ
jgi:hypothetical protein